MSEHQTEIQILPEAIADISVGGVTLGVAAAAVFSGAVVAARKWQQHRWWLRRAPVVSNAFDGDWDEIYLDSLSVWVLDIASRLQDLNKVEGRTVLEVAEALTHPDALVASIEGGSTSTAKGRSAQSIEELLQSTAIELSKRHPNVPANVISRRLDDPATLAALIAAKPAEVETLLGDEEALDEQLLKNEEILQRLRRLDMAETDNASSY